MKTMFRALVAAGVLAVSGAAANAASFSLTDSWTGPEWSLESESEGITMTVYGFDKNNKKTTIYTSGWYGLSVGDHYQDSGEAVLLKFSEAVTLTGFMARFADYKDDYLVKGWNAVTESWDYIQSGKLYGYGGSLSVATVDIAKDYVSKYFWIDTKDKHDAFKLTKISADRVSEVPLPAGAVLLLSGLGLLGLRRRKG